MKVEVEARVNYTCFLSEEDAQTVQEYAEEHNIELELAVWRCYQNGSITLYNNDTVESDFSTEEIINVDE